MQKDFDFFQKIRKCGMDCQYIKLLEDKIKELKEKIEILEKDFLTGTYVRHVLDQHLKTYYLPELKKNNKNFFKILLIDLNNLHEYNRNYGFEAGDEYIKSVIDDLRKQMQEQKVYDGKIYRIGGDEFLVIYPYYDSFIFETNKATTSYSIFYDLKSFKKAFNDMDKDLISKKEKNKER